MSRGRAVRATEGGRSPHLGDAGHRLVVDARSYLRDRAGFPEEGKEKMSILQHGAGRLIQSAALQSAQ